MYLIFENMSPNAVRVFKDLSEQQLQAITDTEDYTIIRIDERGGSPEFPSKAVAFIVMEDQTEELVQGGTFGQDGNVVQVI